MSLIPLLTAIIGYLASIKFVDRRDFWERFDYWHKKIIAEIAFSKRTLPEIFNEAESSDKNDLFLMVAKDYVKNHKTIIKFNFLCKEEKEFIDKYFQNIGTMDGDTQLNYLKSFETELEKYVSGSELKNKRFRPLFIKMGFLIGLVIFILII